MTLSGPLIPILIHTATDLPCGLERRWGRSGLRTAEANRRPLTVTGVIDHSSKPMRSSFSLNRPMYRLASSATQSRSDVPRVFDRRSVPVETPSTAVPIMPGAVKRTMPRADRSGMGSWTSGAVTGAIVTLYAAKSSTAALVAVASRVLSSPGGARGAAPESTSHHSPRALFG